MTATLAAPAPTLPGRRTIGIAMNGVTGRMGTNQHLIRSIVAIRRDGGIPLPGGEALWPEPILIGRNAAKVRALADEHGIARWTTDLDEALAAPDVEIYFDAMSTSERPAAVFKAFAAGKHVYVEKPIAPDLGTALEMARAARAAGVKHGVVHDKLYLPGMRKLRRLVESGFFGRILSLRGEFGYWVFEGDWQPAQRPSWNYRKEDGGGIILDMFCHWRYVLDNLVAPVQGVFALGATHVPQRVDEAGHAYAATADDAAYGTFVLGGGVVAQINSSWTTRVYRDELVAFQLDGTHGSAVVGLRDVKVQHRNVTPKPVWAPDIPNPIDFRGGWQPVPENDVFPNAFRAQWEQFLRHVVLDEPHPYDFLEGAKGVQLAELGMRAWSEKRLLDVPELTLG
ncbi:MAG TPA: Gfo/Idh/MocA family oxidoreductase [Candidatus Limnocylindria bacterium]|jgi:predicted dehydrogenase|nr:Gfo/Idh/MocA family oxidoreductase [Candidatus Limnocylindria bacterium]